MKLKPELKTNKANKFRTLKTLKKKTHFEKTKPLAIFVMMLMVATTLWIPTVLADEIDEQQIVYSSCWIVGGDCPDIAYAQSFIPDKNTITKIEIYTTESANVKAGIASSKSLTSWLGSVTKQTTDGWNTYDFSDVPVNPGNTYYVIIENNDYPGGDEVYLYYANGNLYTKGELYGYAQDTGWYDAPDGQDMAFKVWGNDHPIIPDLVDGPHSGYTNIEYQFTVHAWDPDEDEQLEYRVDWDGTGWSGWDSFTNEHNNDGKTKAHKIISYTWTSAFNGNIEVQSRDDDGALSPIFNNYHISIVGNIPPTAYIDSISPNPATQGQTVQFNGHGTDDDGDVVGYNWRSSVDGYLSSSSSFSTNGLSPGTHTIYFKVEDNEGTWSSEKTQSLEITPNIPPTITFSDINGITDIKDTIFASDTLTISGTANDPDGTVEKVQLSFDDGQSWQDATGTNNWQYDWVIAGLTADKYIIKMKSKDNDDAWSDVISKTVYIEKMDFSPPYYVRDVEFVFSGDAKTYPELINIAGSYFYSKNEEYTAITGYGAEASWRARGIYALPESMPIPQSLSQGDGFTVDKSGYYNIKCDLHSKGWYHVDSWSSLSFMIPFGISGSCSGVTTKLFVMDTTYPPDQYGDFSTVKNSGKTRVDEKSMDLQREWIELLISSIPFAGSYKEILEAGRDIVLGLATAGSNFKPWQNNSECVLDNPVWLQKGHTYSPGYFINPISASSFAYGAASAYAKTYEEESIFSFTVEKSNSLLIDKQIKIVTSNENIPSVLSGSLNAITVDDDGDGNYLTIQDAVDNSNPGDTIEVYSGTYYNSVVINKNLEVIGMPMELGGGSGIGSPIINMAVNSGGAVVINSNNVVISGFKIENNSVGIKLDNADYCTISDNIITNNQIGIFVSNSSEYNQVSINNISKNTYGIWLHESPNNILSENIVQYNYWGVLINQESDNTSMDLCNVSLNGQGLIVLNSSDNEFSNNEIGLNLDNLLLGDSSDNEISYNFIHNSPRFGVCIGEGSMNNIISNNDFNKSGISFATRTAGAEPQIIQGNAINGKPIYYCVNLDGYTIPDDAGQIILVNCENCIIQNLNISNVDKGIQLISSPNNLIQDNCLSDNTYGIFLTDSPNNNLYNNTLFNNTVAGAILHDSPSITIEDNILIKDGVNIEGESIQDWTTHSISNNLVNGKPLYYYANQNEITVPSDAGQIILAGCSNFEIRNAYIKDVETAIQLAFSSNNIIVENTLKNNDRGVVLRYSSNNNILYHNNFIDNLKQAYDNCSNTWYADVASYEGNYWSDFHNESQGAYDNNGNGIVDEPYNISGGDNQDLYPLVEPSNIPPEASFTFYPPEPTDIEVVQFTDTSTDADGWVAGWSWNFGDGSTSTEQNPEHQFGDDGIYNVILTVEDNLGATGTKSQEIEIFNIPPVADANGPYEGSPEEPILLDGSGSSDIDGTIDSYDWDLDNDGQYDDITGVNPTPSWSTSGLHYISLRVTDDDGATDTNDTTVYINAPPELDNITPGDGATGQPVEYLTWSVQISDIEGDHFNWSIECSNGQTIFGTNDTNGTKEIHLGGLEYITDYTIWVNAADPEGSGKTTEEEFTFTTHDGPPLIVYVDDDFHHSTPGFGIDHFIRIQHGVNHVEVGGTVNVYDGYYSEPTHVISIDKQGILIQGIGSPTFDSLGAIIEDGVQITANDITFTNFTLQPSTGTPALIVKDGVNADTIEIHNNKFLRECESNAIGIENEDQYGILDARYNWWGSPNGPSGLVADAITGQRADGYGVAIVDNGPISFEPWAGLDARIKVSQTAATPGTPIIFDAPGSFAYYLDGTVNTIDEYYWDFGDGFYSMDEQIGHVYDTPDTYHVSLRIRVDDLQLYSGFMYGWDNVTINIFEEGTPLTANADAKNFGGYDGVRNTMIQLYGSGIGGTPPYTFEWAFGDDSHSVEEQNPTHTYNEAGTYIVTLTITDSVDDVAMDTAEVTVNEPEPLIATVECPVDNVEVNESISFTGSASGGLVPYDFTWNFGDGSPTVKSQNAIHSYEAGGTYTVILTATDHEGSTDTDTIDVAVGEQRKEAVIGEIQGGFGVKVIITAGDDPVDWTISIDGSVFFGGQSSGDIAAHATETVKLPFSIGFGNVGITVTANSITKEATAFMLGPFVISLKEV